MPSSDVLILQGGFNAQVSKRDHESDLWSGTLGIHDFDACYQAGEEFLEFCATNQLRVMNTWYKTKPIHLGTWMHPAIKGFHMIDHVVMCAVNKR